MSTHITLVQAQAQLTAWLDASASLATAEEYTIGSRRLKRSDADQVRRMIDYWSNQVSKLTAGADMKVRRIVPRDL